MWRGVLSLVLALSCLGAPALVAAQPDASADKATRAKAAKQFKKAEALFRRHEYEKAALAFEEAYEIAPHPAPLFNAARAHREAGNLRRAANLCARYLRDAPESDKRRAKARKLIAELTPKLGRIEVTANGAENVQIDGASPEGDTTFVDPGDHSVSGEFGGERVERKLTVVAGSVEKIQLDPPPATEPDEPALAPAPRVEAPRPEQDASSKRSLSPIWVYAGAGLTAVLGGVTIWSGLDTNSARDEFDDNPTQEGLDDGRAKQTRTNVLLGATAVSGATSLVLALFFVDWNGDAKQPDQAYGFGISPRGAAFHGSF